MLCPRVSRREMAEIQNDPLELESRNQDEDSILEDPQGLNSPSLDPAQLQNPVPLPPSAEPIPHQVPPSQVPPEIQEQMLPPMHDNHDEMRSDGVGLDMKLQGSNSKVTTVFSRLRYKGQYYEYANNCPFKVTQRVKYFDRARYGTISKVGPAGELYVDWDDSDCASDRRVHVKNLRCVRQLQLPAGLTTAQLNWIQEPAKKPYMKTTKQLNVLRKSFKDKNGQTLDKDLLLQLQKDTALSVSDIKKYWSKKRSRSSNSNTAREQKRRLYYPHGLGAEKLVHQNMKLIAKLDSVQAFVDRIIKEATALKAELTKVSLDNPSAVDLLRQLLPPGPHDGMHVDNHMQDTMDHHHHMDSSDQIGEQVSGHPHQQHPHLAAAAVANALHSLCGVPGLQQQPPQQQRQQHPHSHLVTAAGVHMHAPSLHVHRMAESVLSPQMHNSSHQPSDSAHANGMSPHPRAVPQASGHRTDLIHHPQPARQVPSSASFMHV